ncbi:hypothetical protein MuYL_1658 [Mucilaginibacter xinganensis]|uniref:Uncharacterized protein n=1 Tax=Mucilaginibacter xinganensis TaxID=1234841 RepID=A0A223NV49_9SPHI|nr:hypothetical protein MuYL_1658 [Mucilaginibacter xinganensis]
MIRKICEKCLKPLKISVIMTFLMKSDEILTLINQEKRGCGNDIFELKITVK